MEDGGSSLFNFVKIAHKLIRTKQIDIAHWHKVVRIILKQMVEAIEYIHSLNIAHFDISLENWLINDVHFTVTVGGKHQKLNFDLNNISVKLCDFGNNLFSKCSCTYLKVV